MDFVIKDIYTIFFFQVFMVNMFIIMALNIVGMNNIDINFGLYVLFIFILSIIDTVFISKYIKNSLKLILSFNTIRVILLIVAYFIFFKFYYSGLNGDIYSYSPNGDGYFDSGMYAYMAKQISMGIEVENTSFVYLSSSYAVLVHLFSYIFNIFGDEPKMLVLMNVYIYSLSYFFIWKILELLGNISKTKIFILVLIAMFMPGPIYWTASLSKESLHITLVLALVSFLINDLYGKRFFLNRVFFPIYILLVSKYSRATMLPITLAYSFLRVKSTYITKNLFLLKLAKVWFFVVFSYIAGVELVNTLFDFNYYESFSYLPGGDVNKQFHSFGERMMYVPTSSLDMFPKIFYKYFYTIFTESNIFYVLNGECVSTCASKFNNLQGFLRVSMIFLLVFMIISRKVIHHMEANLIIFLLVFYTVYVVAMGFYQTRYVLVGDYLLFVLVFGSNFYRVNFFKGRK
jgi:hypothetical protein